MSGLDLHNAFANLQDGDIERAAAQVEDQDGFVLLLVQAVGQCRSRGFVDDAHDLEAGDLSGILGSLSLAVVEVGRHGDDRLRDRSAQVRLGIGLELGQDHGADLLGAVFAPRYGDLDPHIICRPLHHFERNHLAFDLSLLKTATDETLDGVDGVLGIHNGLSFGSLADQALAVLVERHNGRAQAPTFRRGNDGGCAALHHGDDAVGCSEIDSDDLSHVSHSSKRIHAADSHASFVAAQSGTRTCRCFAQDTRGVKEYR